MRKINLNGHIRAAIITSVMAARREKYPPPDAANALSEPGPLRERDAYCREENEYRLTLSLALGTFRTVAELVEEWPEIERHVPAVLSRPREVIEIP